ncbi:MAG: Hsp20/alpha crystallin family protein [bacterium]|nr:Hsp20/alpha crystallin family protein [bacterium]
MDEETRDYFERLAHGENAGVNADAAPHIELARSGTVSLKLQKEEPLVESDPEEEEEKSEEIGSEAEGQLTIDVYQTPDEIIIESTIAGVKPEDLDINITSEAVTIRGERKREKKVREDDYFYQECYWGKFSRSIILPQEIDPDKSVANLKNGIMTIRLPKLNRQKGRNLKVKFE